MKKVILFTLLLLSTQIFSQSVIYEDDYNNLPFSLRIENSGIYSVASFDVENGSVYFSSFNSDDEFEFKNGSYSATSLTLQLNKDFINSYESGAQSLQKASTASHDNRNYILKKNYLNGLSILKDAGGNISGTNGEEIEIAVPNRKQLVVKLNMDNINNEFQFNYPSNLACADLIGIDQNGNVFIVVEKYLSDIPLKVKREVIVIAETGKILSTLELPSIKYLYTLKDLQIDAAGNLYHLITFPDKVQIVEWQNLTFYNSEVLTYPDDYNLEINFNDYVTTDEIVSENISISKTNGGTDRAEALRIGETYVLHQYKCSSSNFAPTGVTAPDGDVVQTPDWLVVGMNAGIPYKWGGFNTLAQYDAGLTGGKYAGDINTDGVSDYAVGVDCSGFVSRCWQLSNHAPTSYMPNITTQYNSWDNLKPGDAIHKVGHVRLFVERNTNGSFKVVESTSRNWDVAYWNYTASDLSAYTPRYYNSMEDKYNSQRPDLLSANLISGNTVQLNWDCDSTGVIGYRIYSSTDGSDWKKIYDENDITSTFAEINVASGVSYFRVSSVINDPVTSESNWSNVLGINNCSSEKKALIVNGFERETGSWKGAGNTFVTKYGNALDLLGICFNSIKTSELQNGALELGDYSYVFWISGDESTTDETFNSTEQSLVASYLEAGGSFFVSGSEIGWDLGYKGSTEDNSFYGNYLKAAYVADDAGSGSVAGTGNSALSGCSFYIGQTYIEDYPDEIKAANGSSIAMKYSNGKVAGIEFSGYFGSSSVPGSLIYLAFPLETTADDESFDLVISKAVEYFNSGAVGVDESESPVVSYSLSQNYPNPFNPTTTISYQLPENGNVSLKIYDVLGREVKTIVNENQASGVYSVEFNAPQLASGVYIYRLRCNNFLQTRKLLLLK